MRILLTNAHWNNRGDEAALCALIDFLLDMDEQAEIMVIFKEAKEITDFPYEGKVSYAITRFRPTEKEVRDAIEMQQSDNVDMQREMEFVREADIVIYAPGGAVISDRFWWEKQLEYIFPIAYAQRLVKKTVFAAPSVGPFNMRHPFRDETLKKADALCLRESIGMEAIQKEAGVQKNQVHSCDLAFIGRTDWKKAKESVKADTGLKDFLGKYDRVAGLTATDLSWNVGFLNRDGIKAQIEESLLEFIKWLGGQNIGVLLIPQLFGEEDDEKYLRRYISGNCHLLSSKYDSNVQQYLIKDLYALVGLRYHSNIFAAKMGIPMIPIVYEQKTGGFLKDAGIEDWGINVGQISTDSLKNKFTVLLAEYDDRKQCLINNLTMWENRAGRVMDEIRKLSRQIKEGNQ